MEKGDGFETLKELLLESERRSAVVHDCVCLVDAEVAGKKGLAGMAVKGAYAIVKKIKPGIVRETVDHLLDSFVEQMEPFYKDWQNGSPKSIETSFKENANKIADLLLAVTDRRAARARNRILKKAYDMLRPQGVKHTAAAVPGIGQIISRYQ
jgi:hypothetical protein